MGRLVRGMGTLVPGPIVDARVEAAAIREAARRQADAAKQETHAARARAVEEGRALGRDAAAAEIVGMAAAAEAEVAVLLAAAREAAFPLARRMAEKIVGRSVDLSPSILADIAAEALAQAHPRGGTVTVRVHPVDLAAAERERLRLGEALSGGAVLRFVGDESVGRAGCIVETARGRIDARLATQLDVLERALSERRPRRA